jgi:hypothetical protein
LAHLAEEPALEKRYIIVHTFPERNEENLMRQQAKWMLMSVCALPLVGLWPATANAQQKMDVKEKAPMYSYIANWEVSRDKFKDLESQLGTNNALMAKHLADGSLIGFGNDITLVHRDGESTHDVWWSSMSWGGLMKVLQAIKAAGTADAPVFAAGKHNDRIYAARYYNWRAGSFTNGYTRVAIYKLKPGAPENAIDQVAKSFAVPMFEKLLADRAIYEYEIDEEAVHSGDPATFMIIFVGNGPEGLDKGGAALGEFSKTVPFALSAFTSWVDSPAHRDGLYLTTATYK